MFDQVYAQWAAALAPWVPTARTVAIAGIPLGLLLMLWVGRRRVYRRNFAGVEEFNSYSAIVGTSLIEGFATAIGSLALLAGLLAGGFILWVNWLGRY